MNFAVVRFVEDGTSDEYSELPVAWLCNGNKECWWPTKAKNVGTLMLKNIKPDYKTWEKFEVEVITFCSTIESARRRALNSDYASTGEEEQGRGKRKKKKKRVYDTSDEDSLDEDEYTPSPILKKRLVQSQLENVGNTEIALRDVILLEELQSSVTNSVPPECVVEAPYGSTIHNNNIEVEEIDIKDTEIQLMNNYTTSCNCSKKELTDLISINKLILSYVKSMDQRLQILEKGGKQTILQNEVIKPIIKQLPLDKLEDVTNVENFLKTEKTRETFIEYMKSIGGRNFKNASNRILKKIFTNRFSINCSWLGRRNNIKMKDLSIIHGVKRKKL